MSGPRCVVQLLPALETGGVEQSAIEINAALCAAGWRSLVISAGGRRVSEIEAAGGRHVALDIGRKSLLTPFRMPALRRLLRQSGADIVHVRSRLPAWMAVHALRGWGAGAPRLVSTVHGLNSVGRYSSVMLRGDRVICVSECVRRYLLQHYPEAARRSLRVIPRGVDTARFNRQVNRDPGWRDALDAEFPMLRGRRLLLLPGRGTRLKGHAIALRLLAALCRGGDNAALLLAGVDQPERQDYLAELRALARQLQVEDRVAFSTPRSDLPQCNLAAELVLQLSIKPEAFGRTALEALALGRPLLGFDHGGVGDLLRAHYPEGAVPSGDEARLLQRAQALLHTAPEVPMLEGIDTRDMQAATLALYDELLSEPRV